MEEEILYSTFPGSLNPRQLSPNWAVRLQSIGPDEAADLAGFWLQLPFGSTSKEPFQRT